MSLEDDPRIPRGMRPSGRKAPHYFSKDAPRSSRKYVIRLSIRGEMLDFASEGGIFSKDRIDLGTQILINSLELPESGTVLDMGCGYGAIGISIAKMSPSLKVTMVDVNPLAVRLARENALRNGVDAEVLRSDLYSALEGRSFDMIVSNPPLAAGYAVVFPMIEGALSHLNYGGSMQIVLRRGINTIPKKMSEVFGNSECISKKSGYRVFRSLKPDPRKAGCPGDSER
ncbi:MAG: methyltransferase [Candidatus Methanomethylicia archaeon]|nr:methyltransferase [Candidatus Methanomethylicia archaeon]